MSKHRRANVFERGALDCDSPRLVGGHLGSVERKRGLVHGKLLPLGAVTHRVLPSVSGASLLSGGLATVAILAVGSGQ